MREIQKDLKDSAMQLMLDTIAKHGMAQDFGRVNGEIRGPNDSLIIFRGMQEYNSESIKSLEGYDRALLMEARALSQRSLDLLRPTIRKPGSEIWAEWNPESEFDPIDIFFRGPNPPDDAIIRRVNWDQNPWFPDVLRAEMTRDRAANAAKASHIWDGEYQSAPAGAYYAELLAIALQERRIGRVPHDPRVEVQASFDLGVGQNQVVWLSQWVGKELRLIDFIQGDEVAANEGYSWYAREMRSGHRSKYNYAKVYFPHDGRVREATGKSRAETMEGHSFTVEVLPMLPVADGINAVKEILPMTWIDAEKCAVGLTSLKNYRENWDDKLRRSNGPLKDWTNHAADSLRYTVQAHQEPVARRKGSGSNSGGWMAA